MTAQQKIGSGFGKRSTAEDVLAGVDLTGKLAVVTGGYSGLGLETTRALAKAGARVLVPARRLGAAQEAAEGLNGVELDLADLGSVRRFAADLLASGRAIDMLINNAGVMTTPETRVGPGWEAQFAVNHLGHYTLVNLLWPALADGGARVVSVSSAGHHFSDVRWDDLEFRQGYDKWAAYGQAKTANALFATHLDALGKNSGVRAFSLHPGAIFTPLQRHLSQEEMVELGWIDTQGNPTFPGFKTPEQGAATQVWAAVSTQLDDRGGVYCEDCDVAEPAPDPIDDHELPMVGVRDYAVDPERAARLRQISAELTEVDAFVS